MLNRLILLAIIATLVISCKNNKEEKPLPEDEQEQKEDYFPVLSFLMGEIKKVDELPGGILKITEMDGRFDTVYISHEEFHDLVDGFLKEEIQPGNFKKNYSEELFYDQSIAATSYVYESKKPGQEIRRVDIIAKMGRIYHEVSSLFIEKSDPRSDTLSRLLWTSGKAFQLTRTVPGAENYTENFKVVWDQFGGK